MDSILPSSFAVEDLDGLTLIELLDLRNRINSRLPPSSLRDLNLEQELILQFMHARELLATASQSTSLKDNQTAQLVGACTALIKQIGDMQKSVYSSERMKRLESSLIEVLNAADHSLREKFVKLYEASLEDIA